MNGDYDDDNDSSINLIDNTSPPDCGEYNELSVLDEDDTFFSSGSDSFMSGSSDYTFCLLIDDYSDNYNNFDDELIDALYITQHEL